MTLIIQNYRPSRSGDYHEKSQKDLQKQRKKKSVLEILVEQTDFLF